MSDLKRKPRLTPEMAAVLDRGGTEVGNKAVPARRSVQLILDANLLAQVDEAVARHEFIETRAAWLRYAIRRELARESADT